MLLVISFAVKSCLEEMPGRFLLYHENSRFTSTCTVRPVAWTKFSQKKGHEVKMDHKSQSGRESLTSSRCILGVKLTLQKTDGLGTRSPQRSGIFYNILGKIAQI